jgi:hypothetical protein
MSKSTLIKTFALHGTKNGTISVADIEEPYGAGSGSVVSIGISLKGDTNEPDWKAHIPYENIDELIVALEDAKSKK